MINIINSFWGSSGYSIHGRSLAGALNKLTKVKISTNLMLGWETQVNDQELEMIKREEDFETNLIITNPIHWRIHCNAKKNIVYLIWEGDRIPIWMAYECLNPKIDRIIVPSTHTKDAIITTLEKLDTDQTWMGTPEILPKIKIIPHGYNPKDFYPIVSDKKDKDDGSNVSLSGDTNLPQGKTDKDEQMLVGEDNHADTFKFLANKGLRNLEDRGGIQYLIEAYLSEFTESNNVELILKINPAYGIPNLLKMFPGLKKRGIPKITFIPTEYTTKQLNELYNKCDVFISPTRAEAFNLPVVESAACGKMSIVTGYGGQTDFVEDKKTGFYIDYKLVPVTHECEYEECCWATPDITHLRKLIRYAFAHRDEMAEMGKKALENIKGYTWDSTAKQIYSLL